MAINLIISTILNTSSFYKNPLKSVFLTKKFGIIEVKEKNVPVMYMLDPNLLHKLVSITYRTDALQCFFSKKDAKNVSLKKEPFNFLVEEKFKMYDKWTPDNNFIKKSSIWGFNLSHQVTNYELASFISYWKAEGRYFYHVQWQQKLAQSLNYSRKQKFLAINRKKKNSFKNVNLKKTIPIGFRDR